MPRTEGREAKSAALAMYVRELGPSEARREATSHYRSGEGIASVRFLQGKLERWTNRNEWPADTRCFGSNNQQTHLGKFSPRLEKRYEGLFLRLARHRHCSTCFP